MLYNVLSQERPYTRPARFVDKGARRKPRMQERDTKGEVMTFSVDFLPGFSDERGSTTPVYVADRFSHPQQSWTQPNARPVSTFDTDRGRAALISREGVNLRLGVGMILLAIILALALMASSYGQVMRINHEVNTMRDRISDLSNRSAAVKAQIDMESSEIKVSASAREMGMISARGVNVIYLKAPETAVMSNPGTGMLGSEYLSASLGN